MVNLKKIKNCAFFTTFGLSIILASIFYPYPEEKFKTEALASAIERDSNKKQVKQKTGISVTEWGQTEDGRNVNLFTLKNANGMSAKITNYGGILTELKVPDRNGEIEDVVLGFDSLDAYLEGNRYFYFGAIVGRVANWISNGKFQIDGQNYTLATNIGSHHLHGGKKGFDRVIWQAEPINNASEPALKLNYLSPDGEEGYPGNLSVGVIYTLTHNNELKVEMTATTDKPTPVNLVSHSYWNLAGHNSGNILGNKLKINGDRYTVNDKDNIPTGEIKTVKNTAYDFTQPKSIGTDIKQLKGDPPSYNLNYVLNGKPGSMKLATTVYEPLSGRVMEVHTNQPGMQLYTGYFQNFQTKGKGGVSYQGYAGLALETQHFPDSVNKPNFPSVILRPGKTYRHVMVHKFYTQDSKLQDSKLQSSKVKHLKSKNLNSNQKKSNLKNSNKSQNSKLQEILDRNSRVEKVAEGFKFTEGPLWHPDGLLLFSDIPGNTIYQWKPGKKPSVFRRPSGNANGNTFDNKGRLISGEHGNRRVSRIGQNGEAVTIASKYKGKRLNSPNDLVVKSDGSIYFTDPPYGIKSEEEELGFYGVYRLTADGKLTLLVKDFVRPNGIAFSPDESKLYVNDSDKGHIRVFDVKPDGTLSNGRIFAEQKDKTKEGVPDGMKVDTKGNVYSTGPGGVWVFSPSGELLGVIEVPEPPANLAWGGQDYKTLYMTARKSVYSVRLKVPGIKPGGK